MDLLGFRSFSTELLKIAVDLAEDAGMRALRAERRGEEYLKGGELPTNGTVPPEMVPPAGAGSLATKIANAGLLTAAALGQIPRKRRVRGQEIDDRTVTEKAKDKVLPLAQGAAGGAGMLKLVHDMHGSAMTPQMYRAGAGVGAGLVGMHLLSKHMKHRTEEMKKRKLAMVDTNPTASFHSPADQLAKGQETGVFRNRIHQSEAKTPGLLGKPFRNLTT